MSHMEHFDVVQALARTALGGSTDAIETQVKRLASRLAEHGEAREARSLRSMLSRAQARQALEPVTLQPSGVVQQAFELMTLGVKTALPVDKESGAALCEVVFPSSAATPPVLPSQARASFESLVAEWNHQLKLQEHGLPVSRTLLVYGPPGTGKTTLALSIAGLLGKPAVLARLDALISSLLGSTARNMANLFEFCNKYDCILILDEFDAIAKIRDDANEVGEIKRVVNALLQNLDRRASYGLTIAVTNHDRLLDTAVWRRFEHQVRLGLPSRDARVEVALLNLRGHEQATILSRAIALLTEGASGADVRTLTLAFLKTSILFSDPGSFPVSLLRRASDSIGLRGARWTEQPDAEVARNLHAGGLAVGELAILFGRDRRTIGRWLSKVDEGGMHG